MSNGNTNNKVINSVHPRRPDWIYHLVNPGDDITKTLARTPIFPKGYNKIYTNKVTLLPKMSVDGKTGVGYEMVNIDGFRFINAYVISDPLMSSSQRGFSLELSFSLEPFVEGVGVIGESSFFFNFDGFTANSTSVYTTVHCETSDLTTFGVTPRLGGTDLTHILRVPIIGPYVRASVFNEDSIAHNVEVKAYLTT